MFLEEGTTRAGFEIFFKIEGSAFVNKSKIGNELYWSTVFGGRDVIIIVST